MNSRYPNWNRLTLSEQMANIGMDIERAIRWKQKNNTDYAMNANKRALELFELTISDSRHKNGLKEICRTRELWLDFFMGSNLYHQTPDQWTKYFLAFNIASQRSINS